jgi:hypothetical protein
MFFFLLYLLLYIFLNVYFDMMCLFIACILASVLHITIANMMWSLGILPRYFLKLLKKNPLYGICKEIMKIKCMLIAPSNTSVLLNECFLIY